MRTLMVLLFVIFTNYLVQACYAWNADYCYLVKYDIVTLGFKMGCVLSTEEKK